MNLIINYQCVIFFHGEISIKKHDIENKKSLY